MLSILQAISSIAFILLLIGISPVLRSAFKQKNYVSVLIFICWLGTLLLRNRDISSLNQNPLDSGSILRVGAPIILFIVCVPSILGKRKILSGLLSTPLFFFLLYTFIAIFSMTYSANSGLSMFKGGEYLSLVCLGACMTSLKKEGFGGIMDTILTLAVLTISSAVFWGSFLYRESWYPMRSLMRFTLEGHMPIIGSNGLGTLAALCAIVTFYRFFSRPDKLKYLCLFSGSTLTMFLAQSRTSIVMLFTGILLVSILQRKKMRILILSLLIIISLWYGNIDRQVIGEYIQRGQDVEQMRGMTGRVARWEVAMQMIMRDPVLGYGYGTASRYNLQNFINTMTSDTHSTWIEILISLGVIGFSLFLAGLLSTIKTIGRRVLHNMKREKSIKYHPSTEFLLLISAMVTRSITSSSLAMLSPEAIILIAAASYTVILRRQATGLRGQLGSGKRT